MIIAIIFVLLYIVGCIISFGRINNQIQKDFETYKKNPHKGIFWFYVFMSWIGFILGLFVWKTSKLTFKIK